ncbi:MAG: ATP-binding protein [Terrimesophilobacter sp.]
MSIGLPTHLIASASSRSFARAAHAIALTCLCIALATVVVFQTEYSGLILWPAALSLLPMLAVLFINSRTTTLFFSVSYLLVGGASTYWYTSTFFSQMDPVSHDDVLSMSLLQIALVMVGGPGVGLLYGITWAFAGLLVGELSSAFAGVQTGHGFWLEPTTAVVFVITVAVLIFTRMTHRWLQRTPPRLHRAARDEHLAALRYRVELKAAALIHDTILSHLAAIAASTSALPAELRSQIGRDLEILVGEEWLSEHPTDDEGDRDSWRRSAMFDAVQECRLLGLEIDVTGDPACLGRLNRNDGRTLGLAVKQCLVNVLKHSGTSHAEVAVFASREDVSVMVVDTGRGFDTDGVAPDRFGLRGSVDRRIDEVGGSVKVFSTVGRGTSIVIRVPFSQLQKVSGGNAVGEQS